MEKEYKITWTPAALSALQNVHDYIALDSVFYAEKVASEIALFSDSFRLHPFVFQEVVELPTKNHIYRKAIYIGVYKIIYKIVKDEIWILDIFHGKRNPAQLKKLRRIKP